MTLSHSLASFRKFHKLVSNSNGHREKCLAVFVWGPFACMEYYFIFEVFFFFFKLLDSTKGQISKVDSITSNKSILDYACILIST